MFIRFTGPEGAPFANTEIPGVQMETSSTESLVSLQRATKLSLTQIEDDANEIEMFGLQVMLFLSLWQAQHLVSFDTIRTLTMSEFELVPEPGDDGYEDPETASDETETEDPTSAPTDSAQAVGAPAEEPLTLDQQ